VTSKIRITAKGFAALKQQTEQVAQLNRTAATQKTEAQAQSAAIAQAKTAAGETSPIIPSGPDQQAGRTASPTNGGTNNPAAPQKDKDQQNLDSSGRRRNDVPTITKTRELVANGDPPGGVVIVQAVSPAAFDPSDPKILIGPPGVRSDESIGALCPNSQLDIKEKPFLFGQANAESSGSYQDWFLLPLTKDACIAIRIKTLINVWYYFQVASDGYTVLDSDLTSLWESYAFVVSKTKARQIDMPSALENNLKELYPPMTLNSTLEYTGSPFFYPTIPPYTIDVFSGQAWRNSRRYGDYSRANETLSVAFGMGNLSGFHGGQLGFFGRSEFLTPAVYRFLTGPMTINTNNGRYAYMRDNYFPDAPTYYLSRCQLDGTCDTTRVGFDVTKETPIDIVTPMENEFFRRRKKYDVSLNGANRTTDQLYYAWNWDRASYCQQQAIALGFSSEDLTP
jgi:hypothetical protein